MRTSLGHELYSIGSDRSSGATELLLRAIAGLKEWMRAHAEPSGREIVSLAHAILRAQPSMAPMIRLANEVALSVNAMNPRKALTASLSALGKSVLTARARIPAHFRDALGDGPKWMLATYSYSSTVWPSLKQARDRIHWVVCSESRPQMEGRTTAERLARGGLRILFLTDAVLMTHVTEAGALVLGADALLAGSFVNKAGSNALVARALDAGRPVWVLADSTKLLPESLASPFLRLVSGGVRQLWRDAPKRVSVLNPIFEQTPFAPGIRILTENGWLSPSDLRHEINKIRVSDRLQTQA